jgi:hypothetical protein
MPDRNWHEGSCDIKTSHHVQNMNLSLTFWIVCSIVHWREGGGGYIKSIKPSVFATSNLGSIPGMDFSFIFRRRVRGQFNFLSHD